MVTWTQMYMPMGGLGLSALVALIPIIFFFVALAVLRLKGHVAGAITLILSILIAIFAFKMPIDMAFAAAGYGFIYGLWPIAWIIVAAVFLYKLTVASGQFDIIRSSVISITDDQRLQVLLIGFSFGALLEGAAGFGAPVAITGALLVGLGFKPLYAAGLCLIANTAPVAFGALGVPILVAGQVVPVTTPGTKPDLNASFVSANAEQFYQYQPSEIILSEGRLVDSQGYGVAGVNYYTNSGRGVTGENGEFSFSWGETISFGIDTFELGSVRGNKSTIALTELGDEVRGANIDQLIHRYSTTGQNNTRVVPDDVRKVFAEYPNVINEIINLSLSNGATLDEGEQVVNLPNAFIEQFKTGQAKEIDTAICAKTDGCNEARWFSLTTRNVNDGQIQGVINKLWGVDTNYKSVSKFHVFHDSTNFYGSTGNARGQAVVNISNAAFPILMARNDKNYWLAFGEKRAWDKNELAYITEAPSLVEPENVTRDTATFNLPFISLGQVGEGKLMVIGNPHYNSILRCPNGYSWNGGVNKDGQCTLNSDPDDMKNFMENVLRYLSDDKWTPDAKASMTVGTNLDTVYFKRHGQVTGNSAAFDFHPDFAGISVEHLSSYGDLDPQEMPLLILNGFEYVTQVGNDPYAIPLRADTSKPKLTQQDVTDLIAYLNKGGSVLIMENVMSNLKEESASGFVRLLDAAGLSMALNKSVVNNDPQGYPNRVRQQRATGIWVYERYPAVDGALPYTIDSKTGEVKWKYQVENKPDDKPKLEVASWLEDVDGKQETRYAFIDEADHKTEDSLKAAKEKIFAAFPGLKECTNPAYHYEVNCLEYRPGTGVPVTGGMYVPQYTQLSLNADTAKAMVQAADLGTNIQRLYQHELYFRTNGRKGERLSSVDLERLYQNMSVWLWNDTSYRYEEGKNDELGFKTFTEFLNCYANDAYAGGTKCSADLKKSLVDTRLNPHAYCHERRVTGQRRLLAGGIAGASGAGATAT